MRTKRSNGEIVRKAFPEGAEIRLCEVLLHYDNGNSRLVEMYLDVRKVDAIKEQIYQAFDRLSCDYPKLVDYTLCYVKQDFTEKDNQALNYIMSQIE